jgi:hypothetical protein
VSELYRPSDLRLSAKLVPTFPDRGCHVVSETDPHVHVLGFLDWLLLLIIIIIIIIIITYPSCCPLGTLYRKKLALTSPTGGGRYSSLADLGHEDFIIITYSS